VITAWVLITVPLLLVSAVLMVVTFPRVVGTAWASLQHQQALLSGSLAGGDFAGAAVHILAMAAVVLPLLAMVYMLTRLGRQLIIGVWAKTRGKPLRRSTAIVVIGVVAAGLAWAWWPLPGSYRSLQPYERGTLSDVAAAVYPALAAADGTLAQGRTGKTVAMWPDGRALPTREHPQLSMVLVPSRGRPPVPGPVPSGQAPLPANGSAVAPSWVFPFDRPAGPADDGNQALAVNTTDGSITYDVAFALVWAEDGPVDTRNEAYAFANCADCAAVAVGFQVVLIVGQADVVVPENLSAAANYNCLRCLTYALASQLVLTLDGPLSAGGIARLNTLWREIAEFGRSLQDVPLSEIEGRLSAYKEQLMEIVRTDASARPQNNTGSGPAPSSSTPPTTEGTDPGPGSPTDSPATDGPSPGTTADPKVPAPGTDPAPVPSVPVPATSDAAPAPGATTPIGH
jgi:putative peptide zinc metalloprotease protein